MGADSKREAVAQAVRNRMKVAAFGGPGLPPDGPAPGGDGTREIPSSHDFNPRALKPLAKALWATSTSLGHAMAAYRHVNRLKSATVSPDGKLGGRGFVMQIKDLRHRLFDACEALSAIGDTLHDEIQAPHWKSRLAQLDENEAEDVTRFVQQAEHIMDNPTEEADEQEDEIESANDGPKGPKGPEADEASQLPGGNKAESADFAQTRMSPKQASEKVSDSSVDPATLPGPRVDDLDRGNAAGPAGSFNVGEPSSDEWPNPGPREPDYTTPWNAEFNRASSSGMPSDSETETEGWDFGLGFGARGQGAGNNPNPNETGKGVWGPHSGLPGTPSTSVGDTSQVIDVSLNDRRALMSLLPGDGTEPVARADYFEGAKGNLVQAIAELPGEITVPGEAQLSVVDTAYVYEDLETPLVRYDYTTHEDYRPDPIHDSGKP